MLTFSFPSQRRLPPCWLPARKTSVSIATLNSTVLPLLLLGRLGFSTQPFSKRRLGFNTHGRLSPPGATRGTDWTPGAATRTGDRSMHRRQESGGEHPLSRLSSHVKTDVRKADEIMWPSRVARVLGYGILKYRRTRAHAARRTRATPDSRSGRGPKKHNVRAGRNQKIIASTGGRGRSQVHHHAAGVVGRAVLARACHHLVRRLARAAPRGARRRGEVDGALGALFVRGSGLVVDAPHAVGRDHEELVLGPEGEGLHVGRV
eukprot:scaffold75073_cov60-Phaeocystis_antarctica.AAC.2